MSDTEIRIWFGGMLCQVIPVRVVEEDENGRLLALAGGTRLKRVNPGRPIREIPRDEWPEGGYPLVDDVWFGNGILMWQPKGAGHAVWWFYTDAGDFAGWYVNLETRSEGDAVIVDKELDIWVEPDRSWEWKDEESFAAKTGDVRFWDAAEAAEIRAEGERVVKLIEAGAFPFDGTWCGLRP
ncbi:DUF402 domain-containing protein [Longispora albida]|uniref:DUF402 domain-containing protein n=1 Tax=Longispora albida TaxID=203523 RepID=UPI00036F2519|nr:DUF402 domain-containing protein [Longispora albida]